MAVKQLADMTQAEAKAFYSDKVSPTIDVSKLKPQIDGDGNPIQGMFTYNGAPVFQNSDGTLRVSVSPIFDPNYTGGVNGFYTANYNPDGTFKQVEFQKADRNNGGWFGNNLDWLGPLLVGAAAGLGAFMSQGAAQSAAAAALNEVGAGGYGSLADTFAATSAPISESQIAALGSAATPSDLANVIAQIAGGGQVPSGLFNALKNLPTSFVKSALSLLPQGMQNGLKSIYDSLTGGSGSGLFDLAGGLAQLNGLTGASNTAADAYNQLGNENFNDYIQHAQNIDNRTQGIGNELNTRYQNLGTKASGMLGDLATQAKGDYNALGTAAAGTYNGIAGGTKTAYDNLLADVKGTTEKFTPWNVTTNVGSTNKGIFTPAAGTQNVSDQATAAAGSSFGAANAVDVNNLAAQKFGQQQAMLAPYDAQELAKLRANLQATGRTGAASNATGQAISPELAAYYLSKGTRDAGLLTNADQAALNVRGGLVNQGAAASAIPLNIGAQGLSQIGTGVTAGATQASTNNQLASMLGSLGGRGIDAVTQAQLHGADQTLPIFSNAVSVPLGLQKEGIGTMLSQGNKGLDALTSQLNTGTEAIYNTGNRAIAAKYGNFLKSIDQRYQGNLAKATLLAKMFSSLGGMSAKVSQAASQGDVTTLVGELLKQGATPAQIQQWLNTTGTGAEAATSMGNIADPYSWDSYDGITNTYSDSIFN